MKQQIIGKVLVVAAMACLTIIFAALSVHYDVFAFGFRDTPIQWSELLMMLGVLVLIGFISLGVICVIVPDMAVTIYLMPLAVWDNITEKHGKWQHLINAFLLVLSIAFIVYACNLVQILEHLSGEHYRQEATFGGFLAVLYAWVILFGTLAVFGWLSGLADAVYSFFTDVAEVERDIRLEQKMEKAKQQKAAAEKRKKRIRYEKL